MLKVAALQAHERYRDMNGQMRLALRQERNLHLQGLAVRAGKLVRTRNLSEAHRVAKWRHPRWYPTGPENSECY